MSGPGELITRITTFVTDLDDLLKSDVVDAVMSLVKQLGIGAAVATALNTIKTGLTKLGGWITDMVNSAKVLDMIVPVLEGVELLEALLSDGQNMFSETIDKAKKIAAVISDVMDPKRIGALQDSIKRLTGTLDTYVAKLGAPNTPALPAAGGVK